jgi:transcription initiation factor TFIIIB Brf1 subunit/transcription initiation factor TFIIB
LKTADIVEPAKYYLREIEVEKLLKGRSLEAKVAISLLFAGRRAGRSLKPEMLAKYARTKREEINRCYKDLKKTP